MELSLEGFEAVMEFAHEFLVKVFTQGVTSLRMAKVCDVLRVLVNHPHILHQPLLRVGVSVPWNVRGVGWVHLPACVAEPLGIWEIGSHRTLRGHMYVVHC